MFKKDCRCGKSTKNFRFDIGPFYIAECCTAAGYDHLGNKKESTTEELGLSQEETAEIASAKLIDDTSPEPEDIVDGSEGEKQEPTEVKSEEKPKRRYNRGGNVKKES